MHASPAKAPARQAARALRRAAGALALLSVATGAAAFVDSLGREWRPPSSTQGRHTWEQVAALCPVDGATACQGNLGGTVLTDWVWATGPQVQALFGQFAPAILTSPTASVGGWELHAPAAQFQNLLGITMQIKGCPTYQPCFNTRWTIGMTASTVGTSTPAAPLGGEVVLDLEHGGGSFQLFAPFHPDLGRGLWMWRPTGLGTSQVHAYDDAGSTATPGSVTVVPDVRANDWVGGQRAAAGNSLLQALGSSHAGVALDAASGAVRVLAGTPAGAHTLDYRLCHAALPTVCDDARVAVTVRSFALVALADSGRIAFAAGGVAVADVLANDTLGGVRASLQTVSLASVSSTHPGLTLDTNTGALRVAAGTPSGTQMLTYRVCERANPANCAQATASALPNAIDAVNDTARGSSKTGGTPIASVLANDWFNGQRPTTAQVRISLPAALPRGITLNLATGAVSVAPKTSSGTYQFSYTICEIASPTNCDTATVTLDLSGKS